MSFREAFGGSVPRIVPDNLKTGVIKHPAEGEVVLNDAYREMTAHYSAAVLPARVLRGRATTVLADRESPATQVSRNEDALPQEHVVA